MILKKLFPLFLGLLMLLPSMANAHPHNWIDVQTQFTINENSQLTHITQVWEFDLYYSMMTLADVMNEHDSEEIGLPILAADMVKNLKTYNYFSSLFINGAEVQLNKPKEYELRTKKKDGHILLELELTFTLGSKIDVEKHKLNWQVFDPTYYISMLHQDEQAITFVSKSGTECSVEIVEPKPSTELIDYAQNLDKSQKNTDGLGSKFAEKIYISCI